MVNVKEPVKISNEEKIMLQAREYTVGLKYFINTMGCKLNENDSEKIAGMLTEMGYEETDSIQNV